jgi:PAS domain S-box-containing protein
MSVTKHNTTGWLGYIAKAAGGLVILLGGMVVMGWFVDSTTLVQLRPQLTPMQFNTALGFVLCGAGLLLLVYERPRPAMVCGGLSAGFALVTLLQYPLSVDFGIDRLLFEPAITTKTASPGRMALATALAHLLSGLALLALAGLWRSQVCLLMARMFGMGGLALGLGNLLGYAMGGETPYGWSHPTYMAVHTAVGFMLLGTGLLALIWRQMAGTKQGRSRSLALESGLGVAVLAAVLWQSLLAQEYIQQEQAVERQRSYLARMVEESIEPQILALVRMAWRWEDHGGTPEQEWRRDVARYITDQPGLQAIEWVDASHHVRWIEPLAGNEAALGLDLGFEPRRRQALEAARQQGGVTVTRTIDLVQGGKGFLVYVPLHTGGVFDGFMLGVFKTQAFFDTILADLTGYTIRVLDGDEEIYHRGPVAARDEALRQGTEIGFHNQRWRLHLEPTPELLATARSPLPVITLGSGLLLALLLGLAINRVHVARQQAVILAVEIAEHKNTQAELHHHRGHLEELVAERTRELEATNVHLHQEIAEHKYTETMLAEREHYLQAMFDNMLEGVIVTDENGVIESANPAALAIFGYRDEQLLGKNVTLLMRDADRLSHAPSLRHYVAQDDANRPHSGPSEVIAQHANGKPFPISVALGKMSPGGQCKLIVILRDISEEVQAQRELEDSRQQLRDLAVHLQTVREEERTRIARDVHDELGQVLTALNMDIHWLSHRIPGELAEMQQKVLSMLPVINTAIESVQRITSELRPAMLDELGLDASIQWYLEEFQGRTGIDCELTMLADEAQISSDHATVVFRIMQETLTNVARHAMASRVSLDISLGDDHLEMRITDDGRGISPSAASADNAFGLLGMKERALAFGGRVDIEGASGEGTTVSLHLPLGNHSTGMEKL